MPLVGIGTLPTPFSPASVPLPPRNRGLGGTLACGREVGGSPNSDEGHTLWYSLHVRTLCEEDNQKTEFFLDNHVNFAKLQLLFSPAKVLKGKYGFLTLPRICCQ
jgi:hypothetical protein